MKPLPLRVLRRFKHIGLLLLLALTAYLTLGRLLMPLVATRKEWFEQQGALMLGVPVTIGEIKGGWFRFGPSMVITNLRIGDPANPAQQHTIARVEMVLDVPTSLLARQPVVSRISVAKVSVTLQEQKNGSWSLAGVPSQDDNASDPLIDFLLNTKVFTLNEGSLVLQRPGAERINLGSVILNIENKFSSHDMQLQFRLNEQASPAHMALQLRGDPRRSFAATAWLDTEQFDLLPLVKAQLPAGWQWQQLQGRGRFWLEADSNGIQNFTAELLDFSAQAQHSDKVHMLDFQHAGLLLSARPVYGDPAVPVDWNVRIQDAGFDSQNRTWSISKLQLLTKHTPAPLWHIKANELNAGMLGQLLIKVVPMPQAALSALETLDARGVLRNFDFETAPDGSYPQAFLLRSNLDNVAVNAWQQAPSGSGISGYVEANATTGKVEVDSRDFTLHLPLLFERPWHYDKVNARVSWQASTDEVNVRSNFIDVENADLNGRVSFDVHNQRDTKGEWHNEFGLQIGMNRMNVGIAPDYLPTLANVKETMTWLKAALKGGEVVDSAFLLHTITGESAPENDTFVGSWYRVRDGKLAFLPGWPELSKVAGVVVQRNNAIDVIADSGSIAGIAVDHAEAAIRTVKDTQVLAVTVAANTSTALGIDFLRTTPVHQTIGVFMDKWQATGDLALKVGIGIDLHDHDKAPLVSVNTVTHNSVLDMTDFDLQLKKIDGEISYSSKQGLQAGKLAASLFDSPLKAMITTRAPGTEQQTVTIEGTSKVAAAALQKWSQQPVFVRELFNYMQGEIDYKATVKVEPVLNSSEKETTLLIESDLAGLSSSLPEPLNKTRDQKSPLSLELGFTGANQTIDFRFRDLLAGTLQLDSAGIQRGQISLGDRNRNFTVRQADNNTPGVLISGDLDKLDVSAWESVAKVMNQAGGQGRQVADYLRLVDVNIGDLKLPGQSFSKVNVVVRHPEHGWHISGRNDLLSGTLELADDASKPWQVALNYLRLPARPVVDKKIKNPPEEEDPLQDIDPTKLPAFDFKTDEISVGSDNLGAFSLQFRPNTLGASISNFRMKSPDAEISDTTRAFGASMDWRYLDGKHRSSFTGLFSAGDLAKVLPAWGHDASVVSKNASFEGSMEWPGSPLHFSLKRAFGPIHLNINDGRYVDKGAGTTGRVFGALNFDALVRRLKLDFSDIFSKGFTFDRIDGALNFSDGVVTTVTPLMIASPSSNLNIQGEINLREETIAADMQVQVPFGQNVSMVAALMAAWPVALGTYLGSKLFSKQLDDFTTVIYHLRGPWDQTTAGFEPPPEDAKKEKSAK